MNHDKWDGEERRKHQRPCIDVCMKDKEITEMHNAIYGNGDPEQGLLWMTRQNSNFILGINKVFWPLVIAGLIGAGSAVFNLLLDMSFKLHGI